MAQRNFAIRPNFGLVLFSLSLTPAFAVDEPASQPPPVAPAYAVGFTRGDRVSVEVHRTMGSSVAQKRQGVGAGLALLFPLKDSGFDLGIRYVYIREEASHLPVSSSQAFTSLTFVFDYFIWPTKLGGLFVGGEVGVTDASANAFYSVYNNYAYVGKIGYEYTIPGTKWNAAFELRRTIRDEFPLKATRETVRLCDGFSVGGRYRF